MFSFVETNLFSRLVHNYLPDEEYQRVQLTLIRNPEAGVVIQGSGGVRKLRWKARGRGKRGGYRIIYFVRRSEEVIWMLTIYPKNIRDSIPGHILKKIRQEIENEHE
jgi:mRNA-degrading endonuclease RelE of RelBE toxin-antitoxin system